MFRNTVLEKGLQEGDQLEVSWVSRERHKFVGCQIAAYRGNRLLKWMGAGLFRDPFGRSLYTPFLTSIDSAKAFVSFLAFACGYDVMERERQGQSIRFALLTAIGDSHRLMSGDLVTFRWDGREIFFLPIRRQGTVDMNLYQPGQDGFVMNCKIEAPLLFHHPQAIARMVAEGNGLLADVGSPDGMFPVVRATTLGR